MTEFWPVEYWQKWCIPHPGLDLKKAPMGAYLSALSLSPHPLAGCRVNGGLQGPGKGGAQASNQPFPYQVTDIWGLFVTAVSLP